jgi:peptide/nickel transport system substrate-binding protein
MAGYWQHTLNRRLSRRRALAATGATAAAAAFLAACGGGDDDDGGSAPEDKSGLLTKIQDSTKQAKPGGTMTIAIGADLQSLDPNFTTSGSANAPFVYSRLFLYKPGTNPASAEGDVVPDAAESAEIAPDGLTITMKLRRNVKFDERAPTNGKTMTAADVKFSWDRFAANNSSRGEIVYSQTAQNAPIDGMEVVDPYTIRWKFRTPVANALSIFAFQRYMWILPTEAESAFDSRKDSRGSSGWKMTSWVPSVGFTYERNASWHLTPPFVEKIEQKIIPEYTARRAQLLAGNLWHAGGTGPGIGPGGIRAEDVLATKNEQPKLAMYGDSFPEARRNVIGFSYLPNSPFLDVRVRRAVSMFIDRDAWIDAFYNVSKFEAEGLPVDARWDSHYMAGEPPFWIDPKTTALGEGAAYFKFNPDEATKLIKATGLSTPLKMPGAFNTAYQIVNQVEALTGMLNETGFFDITLSSIENQTYNQQYHLTSGKHEGIVMGHSMCQSGDINNHISCRYAVGSGARVLVPEIYPWYQKAQDLMVAQRSELDAKKRLTILNDLQKELAVQMPAVPWPGAATGFSLAWPYMANYGLLNPRSVITAPTETWPSFWYDESKKV